MMHLGDPFVCHRVSHSPQATRSAMPGDWSGHSLRLQKVSLKLRPQEDISSFCRTAVHLSQVIILGLLKALCLKVSWWKEREAGFFLLWSVLYWHDMSFPSQCFCSLRNYIPILELLCLTIGDLDWFCSTGNGSVEDTFSCD